jgi:thiol-disulfide isomerase/thioredoxin
LISRSALRRVGAGLFALAIVSFAGTLHAQDAAEKTAAFRKDLDALFDRFNDAAAGDRLGQAITLCEGWLSKSKGDDKAGDLDVRLELVRLRLAKGDNEAAEKDANAAEKAAVAANSDLKTTAKALYLIAFERSANERLTKLSGDEQKKGVEEFQKTHKELIDNFIQAAGGTKEAAGKIYMEQSERVGTAKSLNDLGKEPKAIGKPDLDGKLVNLADYKGKVVLVDFWATWCGPCMREMPNVVKIYGDYHKRGFEIVGVSLVPHRPHGEGPLHGRPRRGSRRRREAARRAGREIQELGCRAAQEGGLTT